MNAGAVYVLTYNGHNFVEIHQLYQGKIPQGIPDEPVYGDLFGYSLAVGDFDANGVEDLAIGIPYNDSSASGDGAVVVVMFHRTVGIGYTTEIWKQGADGLIDLGEENDGFGTALAVLPGSGEVLFRIYLPVCMKDH